MKQLTILFLLFTLAGCGTFDKLYNAIIGNEDSCIQLESGAWVIYSPDGSTVECEKQETDEYTEVGNESDIN